MRRPPRDYIIRTKAGFERDDGLALYKYDSAGRYLGQFQPDALSEDPGVGEIWLPTYPSDRCYHELTADEMERAEA